LEDRRRRRYGCQSVVDDLLPTLALLLFFTTAGAINEWMIAGMTWEQVLHARLL